MNRMDHLVARQNDVLAQLDELNASIEAVLAQFGPPPPHDEPPQDDQPASAAGGSCHEAAG